MSLHDELVLSIRRRAAMAESLRVALEHLQSGDGKRRARALTGIERVRRTLAPPPPPDLSDLRVEP